MEAGSQSKNWRPKIASPNKFWFQEPPLCSPSKSLRQKPTLRCRKLPRPLRPSPRLVVEGNRPLQGCRAQIPPPLSTLRMAGNSRRSEFLPPLSNSEHFAGSAFGRRRRKTFSRGVLFFFFIVGALLSTLMKSHLSKVSKYRRSRCSLQLASYSTVTAKSPTSASPVSLASCRFRRRAPGRDPSGQPVFP